MKKIKVSEATGPVLDWMVAKANDVLWGSGTSSDPIYSPSTQWSQGGPIIEREGIAIHPSPTWTARYGLTVLAHHGGFRGHFQRIGPTPLIAAMRCFVASHLGDEVEVPEELLR